MVEIRYPPEELSELGCTVKQYKEGIKWLKKLEKQTIKWEERWHLGATLMQITPIGMKVCETPSFKSIEPEVKRQLTKEEVKRLLSEIKRLHLIVESFPYGMMQGVVYRLYANPQADRLAEGLPARGSLQDMKPLRVCFLHWESFKEFFQKQSEPLLTDVFNKLKPFSNSRLNRKWLAYWNLKEPPDLSSCVY
jgi:hypothetical protein